MALLIAFFVTATVGYMVFKNYKAQEVKGGLGTASVYTGGDWVGALVAVNPVGSVLHPGTLSFWAWPFERGDELGGQQPPTELKVK